MLSGLFYLKSLERYSSYIRGVWLVLLLSCFVEISEQCILQHLIWVYTVCLCPFYGALGLNGLRRNWPKSVDHDDGLMGLCFMSLSTLLKPYRDDWGVIMNCPVQWSAIQSSAGFCLQQNLNLRPRDPRLGALTTQPLSCFNSGSWNTGQGHI